ncbi:alpha/beta hydrolase [Clostridium frigidicarnis]|uniref:Acetyl esterase/lipase n=1 Tax=Clostridium frigidicarnis TaxID=84698 RepID=A0A1I0W5V5_9CLOT|nr:alpha/beta hydrolase [Clostridium frigidicarnis]SFA84052.1 Acetyl esterase/lipase [Clostridium frigidicarnis]
MVKFQLEEIFLRFPLVIRTFKYNILAEKKIKYKDFKYGENKRQYYRVFYGNKSENPIIYFIHGGGWWHGSPRMYSAIGKFFCDLGYTVVLPGYRLAPKYKYPNQIEDVFKVLQHFNANEETNYYNKNNIIVMGFSAGGELAANIVFNKSMQHKYKIDENKIKGFISMSGVLDFTECTSLYSKMLLYNYINNKSYIKKINPVNLIDNKIEIPVLCLHGNKDPIINIRTSKSFIKKLNNLGGKGEFYLVKGKHHSDITNLVMGHGQNESKKIVSFIEEICNKILE